MEQSVQWIVNGVFGVAAFLGGWVLSSLQKSIDRLDTDVRAMPEKYVLKSDYIDALHSIRETLERIESKLDGKVDKHRGA